MGVIETHHVVRKREHSLSSKGDAASGDAPVFCIRMAALLPVAVRVENCRVGTLAPAKRTVQISGEIKSRESLKINFLDAVAVALDFAKDMRVERRLLRHRPQAAAH